jgi:hypothetical protein
MAYIGTADTENYGGGATHHVDARIAALSVGSEAFRRQREAVAFAPKGLCPGTSSGR